MIALRRSGLGSDGYAGPSPIFNLEKFFIPASNEPSAVLARAFGECREGHNTKVSKGHLLLCSGVFDCELKAVVFIHIREMRLCN